MELKTALMIAFFHISLCMFASVRNGNPPVVKASAHCSRPDSLPSIMPIGEAVTGLMIHPHFTVPGGVVGNLVSLTEGIRLV